MYGRPKRNAPQSPCLQTRCLKSQRTQFVKCDRCSWRHSCCRCKNVKTEQARNGVPLLVSEHITPELFFFTLDQFDIRKHTVFLKSSCKLGLKAFAKSRVVTIKGKKFTSCDSTTVQTSQRDQLQNEAEIMVGYSVSVIRCIYPSFARSQTKFFKSESATPSRMLLSTQERCVS